jgi:hypothetical protein
VKSSEDNTRVYQKVSGLAAWSENCRWYSSLLLNAVVSLFVSWSSEFCRHNPLCCFSTSVYCCTRIFRYRLSPETSGHSLVKYDAPHRRTLHNEHAHNLYSSPHFFRVIKFRRVGETRNAYKFLIGNHEGSRPLGRSRCRWKIVLKCILRIFFHGKEAGV